MQSAKDEVLEIMRGKRTELVPGSTDSMRKAVIQILIKEYNDEYVEFLKDMEEHTMHEQNVNMAYNMLKAKEDYGRTEVVELAHDIIKILKNNPTEEDLLNVIEIVNKCTKISSVGNHLIIALMLTKELF